MRVEKHCRRCEDRETLRGRVYTASLFYDGRCAWCLLDAEQRRVRLERWEAERALKELDRDESRIATMAEAVAVLAADLSDGELRHLLRDRAARDAWFTSLTTEAA